MLNRKQVLAALEEGKSIECVVGLRYGYTYFIENEKVHANTVQSLLDKGTIKLVEREYTNGCLRSMRYSKV